MYSLVINRVTAAHTIQSGLHELVIADASSGGFTVTLPSSPRDKQIAFIKIIDPGANTVTIDRNGKLIDESASNTSSSTDAESFGFLYVDAQGSWYTVMHFSGGGIL